MLFCTYTMSRIMSSAYGGYISHSPCLRRFEAYERGFRERLQPAPQLVDPQIFKRNTRLGHVLPVLSGRAVPCLGGCGDDGVLPSVSCLLPSRMGKSDEDARPSRRDVYDGSLSGAQDRPYIPRLRADDSPYHPLPTSLQQFREEEGQANREKRLRALWKRIPRRGKSTSKEDGSVLSIPVTEHASLTKERATQLTRMYVHASRSPGLVLIYCLAMRRS